MCISQFVNAHVQNWTRVSVAQQHLAEQRSDLKITSELRNHSYNTLAYRPLHQSSYWSSGIQTSIVVQFYDLFSGGQHFRSVEY